MLLALELRLALRRKCIAPLDVIRATKTRIDYRLRAIDIGPLRVFLIFEKCALDPENLFNPGKVVRL